MYDDSSPIPHLDRMKARDRPRLAGVHGQKKKKIAHPVFPTEMRDVPAMIAKVSLAEGTIFGSGQQHHAFFLLPVHLDNGGTFEMDVAQVLRFLHGGLRVEEILVVQPIVHVGVDSEVTHPEGSQ